MNFDHIDTSIPMVQTIIRTSFEVFAKNDFKKASTNLIVQTAGISRGILYHYFESKEDLFNYLSYFALRKSFGEIDASIDWEGRDLILRISDLIKYRLDMIAEYPYMVEFGEKYREKIFSFTEPSEMLEWRVKVYELNIDYEMFDKTMKMSQILHTIKWTFRGVYKELLEKIEPNKVIDETEVAKAKKQCDECCELLSKAFYR